VWYHKCPSRGKNCQPYPGNTKLTIPFGSDQKLRKRDDSNWIIDEGGCSTWYDEPDLIRQVEKRIGMPMKVMDPEDFSVPGVLESPLGPEYQKKAKAATSTKEPPSRRALRRKKEETAVVTYGAKKDDATMKMSAKQTSALAPVVNELASLEREIQQMFGEVLWNYGVSGMKKAVTTTRPFTSRAPAAPSAPRAAASEWDAPAASEWDAPAPATASAVPQEGGEESAAPKRIATSWSTGGTKPKRKARW